MPRIARRNESPRGYNNRSTPEMSIIKYEYDYSPTPSPHLIDHGYGATPIHQLITPNNAPAPVKRKLNLEPQHFVVPIKPEFKLPPQKRLKKTPPAKKNSRYNTSLGLLTKKFSEILEESPDGVVDLNKASATLDVQKRRIYDITNVLEGVGIVEKKSKNNIQWKGGGSRTNKSYLRLMKEVKHLEDQENKLNAMIECAESELRQLNNDSYGYVTYQDLRSISKFKYKTVMAIKAPPNTKLSVPTNDDDNYCIMMKSESDEIEVFLCPDNVPQSRPKPVPPIDPLLKDIKLSPGLFNITTPPVPFFDSPLLHKPISLGICRSLSFTKDNDGKNTVQKSISFNENASSLPSRHPTNAATTSLNLSPLQLSPLMNEYTTGSTHIDTTTNSGSISTQFLMDSGSFASVAMGRYNAGSAEMGDPLLCGTPFVPLDTYGNSDYNFGLDSTEGLADLFDFL